MRGGTCFRRTCSHHRSEVRDSLAHACGGGRRAFFHRANPDARFVHEREMAHHATPDRRVVTAHTDVGTPNASFPDQGDGDTLRGVRTDGETNPLRTKNNRGVHADNGACRIDQRSARIARLSGASVWMILSCVSNSGMCVYRQPLSVRQPRGGDRPGYEAWTERSSQPQLSDTEPGCIDGVCR